MKYVLFFFLLCFSLSSYSLEEKEILHLTQLANEGNSEAMYSLWLDVAERGDNQEPPTKEEINDARGWLIKAGELNNWRAAFVLELCYSTGCWGFDKNENKAKHYKQIYEEFRPESPQNQ